MTQYKVITTLTWRFDSDESKAKCLEMAKAQLEEILNTQPVGDQFDGFGVQMDIARMKDRKKLVHIAEFCPEEVFPYITVHEEKREYVANGKSYLVRMNSDRYFVFRDNAVCVSCGIVGTKMILDMNPGDQSPHFNLYGEEVGRLVLMTKDHIMPKSRGGEDVLGNYRTMCSTCNNLRGHYDLSLEQIRELKVLSGNPDRLPRKELRNLVNQVREQFTLEKLRCVIS